MGLSHERMEYIKNDLRSKVGGRAEKAIKKSKMRRIHKAADKMVLGGVPLKNSFNFKYLGFEYQANG